MGFHFKQVLSVKSLKRINLIAWNTAFNMAIPVFSLVFSITIIRIHTPALWGEIISYTLAMMAVNRLVSWGHKEFLLKTFSKRPKEIASIWQENVYSRTFLVLIASLGLLLFFREIESWITLSLLTFGLFIYRAFDPVTIFFKRFKAALIIEILGFLVVIAGILIYQQDITALLYLRVLACSYLGRALIYIFIYRKDLLPANYFSFSLKQLKLAFPYVVLTFFGLLNNQINSYSLALLGDYDQLGRFQVLFLLFLYVKNGAYFIIQPFLKNLLRANKKTHAAVINKLFPLGILLSVVGGIFISLLFPIVYSFSFSWEIYALGVLYAIPFYFFAVKSVNLMKNNQERWLMAIGVINILITLMLDILLIPSLGIKGAMIAAVVGQWTILLSYVIIEQKKWVETDIREK